MFYHVPVLDGARVGVGNSGWKVFVRGLLETSEECWNESMVNESVEGKEAWNESVREVWDLETEINLLET